MAVTVTSLGGHGSWGGVGRKVNKEQEEDEVLGGEGVGEEMRGYNTLRAKLTFMLELLPKESVYFS